MNQPIKVLKNRSDIGAGTRGSDMGIDALEIAAINAKSDFFNKFPFIDIPTHNETVYNKVQNTTAKRINFVVQQCSRLTNAVLTTLKDGFFPIILSGDHSSALGSLAGIKKAFPAKTLGVVWIDAHADLHSPYSTPSGNVHGMPLAAALGNDNIEFQKNPVGNQALLDWEELKNMGGVHPILEPQHLMYFGVRDYEAEEAAIMKQHQIKNYPVHELRQRSFDTCITETLERLAKVDLIYITFDVDALDCDLISHGTGTPVSKGFDPQEIIQIIQGIQASNKVVALEVCEINPLLDEKGNRMAEAAFEVVKSIFN
ncbi:MAG: arginase [Flavobacteriaceae bacterium]|nr:arginase [Flavobacteriaceae bacterium]